MYLKCLKCNGLLKIPHATNDNFAVWACTNCHIGYGILVGCFWVRFYLSRDLKNSNSYHYYTHNNQSIIKMNDQVFTLTGVQDVLLVIKQLDNLKAFV